MTGSELKRRLTPMDAFFLFGESDDAPMTVGAVALFEGQLPFSKFVKTLDERLHLIPRYRQIVVHPPFNIGMPSWEDDPDFDIGNHVHEVRLGRNVSEDALREFGEECFEGRLDMDLPLWEIFLVPNVQGNRTGMVCRVHHAMVDGIAGISLMHVLFDVVSNPEPTEKKPFEPEPLPNATTLFYDALWDNAIDGVEHWTNFQKGLASFASPRSGKKILESLLEFAGQLGDLLSTSRRFEFNKPFNGARKFAFSELSFAEVRAIKAKCGGTINDVALTVLAGAVTEYLEAQGENTLGEELGILCPVNIRAGHEDGAMGNRISFLPVKVPLDLDDPLARLEFISGRTRELKENGVPETINLLFSALQGLPAPVQKAMLSGLAAPAMKGFVDKLPQIPPGNLIFTNVPGPQIPLYSCGHRMLKYYALLPLALEMGISCGVTSYEQTLYFTFMGDGNCASDVDFLRDCHGRAFEELRKAAEIGERHYVPLRYSMGRRSNGSLQKRRREKAAADNRAAAKPAVPTPQAQ